MLTGHHKVHFYFSPKFFLSIPRTSGTIEVPAPTMSEHTPISWNLPSTPEGLKTLNLGNGNALLVQPAVRDALNTRVLRQRFFRMGAKQIPMPRLTGMTADLHSGPIQYKYSGGVDVAVQETKSQFVLRRTLNKVTGTTSTCGLWNAYGFNLIPDEDLVVPISDDEREISFTGAVPMVIGVTWLSDPGDKWVLVLRSKTKNAKARYTTHKIRMESNQVFCMGGVTFQQEWTHEIPKSSKTFPHPGQRVSVTYRRILPNARVVKRCPDSQLPDFPAKCK